MTMAARSVVARRALAAVGLFLMLVLATSPRVPYEWDAASTWIARAEQERVAPGTLLASMQRPGDWPLLMPSLGLHTYPIGHAIVVGTIARWLPPTVSAKRAADLWLGALLLFLLWQLHATVDPEAGLLDLLPTLLIFACPFVVVHLRSGYADLFVGVLAAIVSALALRLTEAPTRGRWLAWAVAASLLCQVKVDGVVLLVASSTTVMMLAALRRRWSWRVAAAHALMPILNVAGWWWLLRHLFGPGMPASTRALGAPSLAHGARFAYEAARHLLDVDTWGWTWGLLVGLAIARSNLRWGCSVAVAMGLYGAAHLIGPTQMTDFLVVGTVMNRLLLQVLVASIPFAWPVADRVSTRPAPATVQPFETP
jgi:hypothetical protein